MTHIIFYEKPGCSGNSRQRNLLLAADHTVEPRNLLMTCWTAAGLLDFLRPLPVGQWFNRAAPRIKSGEIDPEALNEDAALALLLTEPLLVRRPLMQRADDLTRHIGFDAVAVHAWVGLDAHSASAQVVEGCASPSQRCTDPL